MTIPFNYSFDSTSRECAKTDTLSLKSVIMRMIDYPKARNRPQPAGSNRRVDLAMRPAAEGRICPEGAKEGWGRMEQKGTLGKEGAHDRKRGLTRCGGEPLEGGTGTMRQGEHLEGKAAPHPVRYPLIEDRASRKWPWIEALVHFSRMRQRCHPAILAWIQFARLLALQ